MSEAYFYQHPNPGFLRLTGPDRVDFIQRQSTNDLSQLAPGRMVTSVLTNPAARIIDVLQLFTDGEEGLAAITLPGRGPTTTLFLKKRIFFMDKVTITEESGGFFLIDVEGPGAIEAVRSLALDPPIPDIIQAGQFESAPLQLIGQYGPGGTSIRIIGPSAVEEAVRMALADAGLMGITREVYDTRRIEAGLPGHVEELTEEYTPLEIGLDAWISDTKGCYTGQEVITRQITYDKITRRMAGIKLTSPAQAGSRVLVDGSAAGILTSYTYSPRFGPIGLAVLKRPIFEPGTRVEVTSGSSLVSGEVSVLPFLAE